MMAVVSWSPFASASVGCVERAIAKQPATCSEAAATTTTTTTTATFTCKAHTSFDLRAEALKIRHAGPDSFAEPGVRVRHKRLQRRASSPEAVLSEEQSAWPQPQLERVAPAAQRNATDTADFLGHTLITREARPNAETPVKHGVAVETPCQGPKSTMRQG